MISPTIREELGRLRQSELARAAERRGRLVPSLDAPSARRAIAALLAPLHRRSMPPTGWPALDDGVFRRPPKLGAPSRSHELRTKPAHRR